MAIVINYAGASILQPGAYSRILIASGGASQAQLGIMAIVGEADSGPQFNPANMQASVYTPSQYSQIANTYVSGELVDMAKLAFTPSLDPDIVGGAQSLVIVKTNAGTAA